ncbi:MAG: hypothetical protein IPF84_14585 [Proteobacteria bacterium]|nr:hypothetical protein [Pseudomonadota bacterium]
MKTALLSVLLTVGSAVAAAPAADPVIGTWQINVAKSKFSPGPAPKSDTRIYAATEQGTAMTWTSVGTDGGGDRRHVNVQDGWKGLPTDRVRQL